MWMIVPYCLVSRLAVGVALPQGPSKLSRRPTAGNGTARPPARVTRKPLLSSGVAKLHMKGTGAQVQTDAWWVQPGPDLLQVRNVCGHSLVRHGRCAHPAVQ